MGEDFDYWYGPDQGDDAARERPSLDQLQTTLAKVADIDWVKVTADLTAKIQRPARIQRALDTPMKQRTALDAAHVALARLIQDGFCK